MSGELPPLIKLQGWGPETLALDVKRRLTREEVMELVLSIDSHQQSWSFTAELIQRLQEALP